MKNNVSSTSLKSLLDSYDRDAAANSRNKISTVGSSGASNLKSNASALASTIPQNSVVPEISASDAKSLMNAYYKPYLAEAKAAATAEKKAIAEAKAAAKKKSSGLSISDPNEDGSKKDSDFWNQGKDNSKSNRNNKPDSNKSDDSDKEKKPGLLAKAAGAVGSLFSGAINGLAENAANRTLKNSGDEVKEYISTPKSNQMNAAEQKQAKLDEARQAAAQSNQFLATKKQLSDSDKNVIFTRYNNFIQQGDNRNILKLLDQQKQFRNDTEMLAATNALLSNYDPAEVEQAQEYKAMYDRIPGYRVADRSGNTAASIGKTIASVLPQTAEYTVQSVKNAGAELNDEAYNQATAQEQKALNQMQALEDSGQAYTYNELGQATGTTPEYKALQEQLAAARKTIQERKEVLDSPVSQDSLGYQLYQSGQENLKRSELGLTDSQKLIKGAATSAVENLALATVNPALVLPVLSAQGAADSMGQSTANEEAALTGLTKGVAKGIAGYAINSVGVEQMLDTMGLAGTKDTLASQIVQSLKSKPILSTIAQNNPTLYSVLMGATDNGLQSFAESWADYAIDIATNTAEPMTTEQLLNKSLNELASGALGGAFTGLAGSAVNAGRQAYNRAQDTQNAPNAQNAGLDAQITPSEATADNLSPVEQAATDYDLLPLDETNGVDKQKIARAWQSPMDAGKTDPRHTPEALAATTLANQSLPQEAAPVNEDLLTYGLLDDQPGNNTAMVQPASDEYDLLLPEQPAATGDGGYGANTVGAAESKFDRSTAPNLDIAEQSGIQNQLNDAARNAYGESNQLQHDVYSHKQGDYEAAMNLDLSISEAGGDTTAGINSEVKRLTDVSQWNAEDQYSAKEVRNRISQQLNQAAESGADTTELVARLHAVDDLISMKRSQIGQALEAGKEAALSSENVSQKFSQYKQEQAQKFAQKNKDAAKTMEEIASEISDADLSSQQKDFILDFIKEKAKAKKVDITDSQAEKLAQMVQMGAKTEQFYNTILEFATGVDDLSLDQIEQIDNLIYEAEQLPENSRDRVEKEKQIYAVMASATKAGFMDKVDAWRYLSMLGNTRTHARNIIGNEAMGLVTGAKDVAATLIEHAAIRDKSDRTKAVLLPTKADNELLGAAYKYANESRYRQLTDNSRFNVKSGVEGEKTVFKHKVAEKARLANNAGLEESDYSGTFGELAVIKEIGGKPGEWAGKIMERANKAGENGKVGFAGLRAQFARSMAQQMKAKGLSADILTSTDSKDIATVERMAETAVADAQRATFHEYSNTASWLSDKTRPSGVRKFFDAELPFTKTPINIVKQAARYSPMGVVKTATVDAYNLSKGNITVNKFVDNLAMGLTGTGIALAGAWLANSGILFVPDNDDKKQSFNEMQGKQGYSVIIDGKSYTIDWLAPAALPLLMGASIAKSMEKDGFGFGSTADAISSLADPMIETTMLSSLSDTLESIRYSDSGSDIFSTLLVGAATNYGGQFVPTALGQAARSQDEHRRSSKAFAEDKLVKQGEYFMRKQINKIPGLGEALDYLDLYENADYVDAWGRKQENGGLAYNTLSPGYLRDVNTTKADQYIEDLYDEVGSAAVLPSVSSSDADVDLTPDSYEKYATAKGKTQAALIGELAGQEYVSDMPAEVQKKVVSSLYSVAKMAGNKSVDPLWESDSKDDQKLYSIYDELGVDGLVDYVAGSKAFAEIKSSDNPAETAELYTGVLDELTPSMVSTYMESNKKPYQAYVQGGVKAMAAYETASDRYSQIKDDGGKYVDAVLSLDDATPTEQGYIYTLHSSNTAKVKYLTDYFSDQQAYKLAYWFMRYSAIKDTLKAQIKDTDISEKSVREDWADQYITDEWEREAFLYLYNTARKDWNIS